ncbi:MAG: LysM peptidoglycan-binding domain-containing protein [Acidobacteria bacterium]|nr:LysM peptidoglycan-binding domain-containing protein [Acidobacteriota bacterium]
MKRSATTLLFFVFLGLLTTAGLSGCASAPRAEPQLLPRPVAAGHDLSAVARAEALQESLSQVSLAREQARLGLVDDAAVAWQRAIDAVAPFAAEDAEIAGLVQAIENERDKGLADAALHDVNVPGEETASTEETEEILQGPEPSLDPSHLGEVDEAAHEIEPDYPIVINDKVLAWLEAFTAEGRLRTWFTASLVRSGGYVERFRQIFAEEGVPKDLVYLAHVESAFKTGAYSRAHARGIFQFIAGTARRYGLTVDSWLDERGDPEKSCRAAAAYLRDLYAEFGDWYLALAAYNAGEGRIRQAMARTNQKDFWIFSDRRLLRQETRNYVPAILAATIISKNPKRFGLHEVKLDEPQAFEVVSVPVATDLNTLASCARTDAGTLRALNPELRRGVTPPHRNNYQLKVPVGHADGFAEAYALVPVDKRIAAVEHRVRRGDTLSKVASRYGVTVSSLRAANGLGRRSVLKTGQVLVIPGGAMSADAGAYDEEPETGKVTYYRVRRGDTLSTIARRFHVTTRQLQAWNKMGKSTRISAGARLRVRTPERATGGTAVASSRRSTAGGSTVRHTVRKGETLWSVARRYGVTLEDLRAANGLGRKSTIKVGQKLKVPGQEKAAAAVPDLPVAPVRETTVHVVRRGETLFRIAQRYGLTVEGLCALNNLAPNAVLHPGDQLKVAR